VEVSYSICYQSEWLACKGTEERDMKFKDGGIGR